MRSAWPAHWEYWKFHYEHAHDAVGCMSITPGQSPTDNHPQTNMYWRIRQKTHSLYQWFLTGVRPNPRGSVNQPQGFGRDPQKYKHSCRVQSDWGQPATKRRRVGWVTVICSWRAIVLPVGEWRQCRALTILSMMSVWVTISLYLQILLYQRSWSNLL